MSNRSSKLVLFTDLDGTLLDPITYSYEKALPSIEYLQQRGIPIVFCSAKTGAEQEAYREKLGIHDPFIVENGGAIFISEGYFPFSFRYHKAQGAYRIIELGKPYHEIRQTLGQIRTEFGVNFRGFGDMSAEEVAAETGLDLEAARRAKEREYDETVKLEGTPEEMGIVLKAIEKAGLNYTQGGRYYSVMGASDKGRATTILIDLFHKKLGQVETVGIGDSLNDLPMLSAVDIPILVQKPGEWWEEIDLPQLNRVKGVGPEAWSQAITELIDQTSSGKDRRLVGADNEWHSKY